MRARRARHSPHRHGSRQCQPYRRPRRHNHPHRRRRLDRFAYRLTGISEVDALLPITTIIDRGYPAYAGAPSPSLPSATNYIRFLDQRTRQGRPVLTGTYSIHTLDSSNEKDTVTGTLGPYHCRA